MSSCARPRWSSTPRRCWTTGWMWRCAATAWATRRHLRGRHLPRRAVAEHGRAGRVRRSASQSSRQVPSAAALFATYEAGQPVTDGAGRQLAAAGRPRACRAHRGVHREQGIAAARNGTRWTPTPCMPWCSTGWHAGGHRPPAARAAGGHGASAAWRWIAHCAAPVWPAS